MLPVDEIAVPLDVLDEGVVTEVDAAAVPGVDVSGGGKKEYP